MNYAKYLIKEAVTVARLAQVAKKHGIPLLGDWRYATKLLHKAERASPAGKKHYERALGFMTPREEKIINYMRDRASLSPVEYLRLHHKTMGSSAKPEVANELVGKWFARSRGDTKQWPRFSREIEYAVAPTQGNPQLKGRHQTAVGVPGAVPVKGTRQFGRLVHTHPLRAGRSRAGLTLPSVGHGVDMNPTDVASLSGYLDKLKRLKATDPLDFDMQQMLRGPLMRKQWVILQPETRMQSVSKLLRGKLNRIYFKGS